MVAALELITISATATLLAEPALVRGPLDIISQAGGFRGGYYGFQNENTSTAYIFADWDSIESPAQNVRNNPEVFAAVTAKFDVIATQFPTLFFAETDVDYRPAITAPVVEIIRVEALKEGRTKRDFEDAVCELEKALKTHVPSGDVYLPAVHGSNWLDAGQLIIYLGWKSQEAQSAAIANKKVGRARDELLHLFDGYSRSHTQFTKHE